MVKKLDPRRKVPYRPRFAGAFKGRAFNAVRRIYPKLAAEHEFDDLLQEAALVFLVCREKYLAQAKAGGRIVDNPAWFMSLFSRALYNRFVDLQRASFSYIPIDELADADHPMSERDLGFCWRTLCELPADVRELLTVLGGGDDSVLPALERCLVKITGSKSP